MPNVDANAFEFEEQNGGHSPEISYTPAPADTILSSPLRWIVHVHLALFWRVGVAVATGGDVTHPEETKSGWCGDKETACSRLLKGA